MKHRYLLICILALTLGACSRFIVFLNGGHKPRVENEITIRSYSEKMGWSQENIYTFRDSAIFYRYFRDKGSLPSVAFFNKDMFYLEMLPRTGCNARMDSIIEFLEPGNTYKIDSSKVLTSLIPDWCDLKGRPIGINDLMPADFYVVIYWATFVGRLNKRDVKPWEEQLNEKAKTMGIEVFKVNCDFMESWVED